MTNVHYAVFSGLLVLLVLAHGALARDRAAFRSRWKGAALAAALAGIAVLPFYIPYAKVSKIYGMVRSEGEIEHFSGRPVDFLTAGPQNKLYAPLTQKWAHAEGDFFPGLVPLGLAAFALVRLRRQSAAPAPRFRKPRSRAVPLLDALAGLGLALWAVVRVLGRESIGPVHLRDPGRILVFVAVLVLIRLLLRFPARSRYANLADFARRSRLPRPALLFAAIACLGCSSRSGRTRRSTGSSSSRWARSSVRSACRDGASSSSTWRSACSPPGACRSPGAARPGLRPAPAPRSSPPLFS